MIAKITCGSSMAGVVGYNESKVERDQAYRIQGDDIFIPNKANILKCLTDQQELYTGKSQKTTFHASLSFSEQDKHLDPDDLKAIADDYMHKIGYEKQPYQVYEHLDKKGHQHIHIVSTRVNDQGKLISDSNNFYQNKRVCRELEKDFNLVKVPNARVVRKDYSNGITSLLHSAIEKATQENKPASFKELKGILKELNIEFAVIKRVKGKDLINPGITFFMKDPKNGPKSRSVSMPGAKVGFSYSDLYAVLAQNKITRSEIVLEPERQLPAAPQKEVLQNVLQTPVNGVIDSVPLNKEEIRIQLFIKKVLLTATTPQQLIEQLAEAKITVKLNENKTGIVGASFALVDQSPVKGSRLGYKWSDIAPVLTANKEKAISVTPAPVATFPIVLNAQAPAVITHSKELKADPAIKATPVPPVKEVITPDLEVRVPYSPHLHGFKILDTHLRTHLYRSNNPLVIVNSAIMRVLKENPTLTRATFTYNKEEMAVLLVSAEKCIQNTKIYLQSHPGAVKPAVTPAPVAVDRSQQVKIIMEQLNKYSPTYNDSEKVVQRTIERYLEKNPQEDPAKFAFTSQELKPLIQEADDIIQEHIQEEEDEDQKQSRSRGRRR